MDVGAWLRSLGLAQYEQAFSDNAVDAEVLPQLTAEDIKDIGVTPVGDRRKLLAALAHLRAKAASDIAPSRKFSSRRELSHAERRQLTVLFVDLVESTKLAAQLDPEEMSSVLHAFQNTVAAEVNHLEGCVAKLMGDGALCYFGWPQTHEDAAERAVKAALRIASAVGRLSSPIGTTLAARVGIATGLVVVGEVIGHGAAQEETAVGDTLNLAARLQTKAPPGGILISETTRHLLGHSFQLTPLRPLKIKGYRHPIRAWQVHAGSKPRGRFEERLRGMPGPIIGREQEQAFVLQHWIEACSGAGRAILLVGEAGIGKSRLLRSLADTIADEEHDEVWWQCSPLHRDIPLRPVLGSIAGLPAEQAISHLAEQLKEGGIDSKTDVALVMSFFGTGSNRPREQNALSPEAQRFRVLCLLVDYLVGRAARRPLLLVLEDAHWADGTTLELIRRLSDRLPTVRLLLIVASRLETPSDIPCLAQLVLCRLQHSAVSEMVYSLVPEGKATSSLMRAVLDRADGIPLFVEELSKTFLEKDLKSHNRQDVFDLPSSLQDVLMARLDGLHGDKDVAQLGACIGREFNYTALAAIADRTDAELRRGLEKLCSAELLFQTDGPPEITYSFKHALVRDAAYESILKSKRRAIHARLVEAIEHGTVSANIEEVAHHAAAAGLWNRAVHHYGSAAKAAANRGSNIEALASIGKAIDAASRLPDDAQTQAAVIDLLRARGWVYLAVGDTAQLMSDLRTAGTRAARLGWHRLTGELNAQRAHAATIFGGTMRRALGNGRKAAAIAQALDDAELMSVARFVLGLTYLFAGDYRRAISELSVDADAYLSSLRMAAVGSSGTLAVDGLAVLGDAFGQLGLWDEALARGQEAQRVAQETGFPWDTHVANYHLARTLLARGDAAGAMPLITWNLGYGERCGLPMVVEWHQALLAHVCLLERRYDDAVATADRAIDQCTRMKLCWTSTLALLIKAEALLGTGHPGAAYAAADALRRADRQGYRALKAMALRILACCIGHHSAGEHRRARQ